MTVLPYRTMAALVKVAREGDRFARVPASSMTVDRSVTEASEFTFAGSISGGDETHSLTLWSWETSSGSHLGTLLVRHARLRDLLGPYTAASGPRSPTPALRLVADTSPLLPEVPPASDADRAAVAEALGQGTLF